MTEANELQERAERILRESRFHERRTPSPFRGTLRWLGDRLDPVLGPLGRIITRVIETVAGWWGEPIVRALIIVVVVGFAALLSTMIIQRRSAVGLRDQPRRRDDASVDPADLERAADRAETAGDYPEAVRLRFQAGVLRLQHNGKLRRGRSMPTRAIGRQLRLPEFDRLGQTFDAVAYGGRTASASDASESKRGWERVLAETGKRS